MWLGMCCRWPASGTSPRSRSAAGSALRGAPTSPGVRYRCRNRDASAPRAWPARSSRIRFASTHAGTRCGFAGSGVPQRPCGDVDQCVGRQCLDVDVVGIGRGQRDHRVGVGRVTRLQASASVGIVGGEAGRQGVDQTAFDRRSARPSAANPSSIRARASEAARSTGSNASQALL